MKIIRSLTCLPTILLLLGLVVPLAEDQGNANNLNSEVLQLVKEAPSKETYREAGAVILLKEGRMTVGKDGLYSIAIHVVGKFLDDKAVSDYGQISRTFNSYYQDATLDFARTIKKDGKIVEVSKDATQIKTLPGVKRYTDVRSLAFSLPALEAGSVFEYQVTKKKKRPIIKNKWDHSFRFNHLLYGISRIDPVYKSRFVLKVPEGEKFVYQVENTEVSPTIKKEGDFVTYAWEVENLPAIAIEKNMPPIGEMIPRIRVSSLKGWNEVDEWASGVLFPSIEVTEEIKAKAQHITRKAETEEEKIEALFYFMQSNIEYVQADLLRGGYKPHSVNEILENKYGDCKDQVVLFLSMLKAVGITAYPAFINQYPAAEVNKQVPSLNFSHLIVHIPRKGVDLWLDTTSGVTEFPRLHWPNQDQWALVIDGKGGKFLKAPSSKPEDNQGIIRIHSRFEDGTLNGKMTVEGKGAMSDNMKSLLKALPAFQQENIISQLVKAIDPNAQVQKIEFSELENPQLPFQATAFFELKDLWKEGMTFFFYTSSALLMVSFFTELHNLPSPEDRKNDYVVSSFKFKLVQEWLCSPPAKDFRPSTVPQEEFLDTRLALFRTEYPREGESVRSRCEFGLKQNRIRKEEYKAFYESIQELVKKSHWRVAFKRPRIDKKAQKLEAALQKSPQDAKTLLKLAKHYLTKGKYEEAKELLGKAVVIDPKDVEIHYFLGVALGYLDQYDEGKKQFQKAKELGYEP
ncbi:MAG: DUF3857 domain-containing protein [Candidatus Aerophobus sp.]|nr:MAG: DUF3857 domain-containing protein [Candidatus Aerophobus sp.]